MAILPRVERLCEVELLALLDGGQSAVANVGNELGDVRVLGVQMCALVGAGQKRAAPVARGHDGIAAGTHHNEARQVFVLCAEPVIHPRAKARSR